MKTVRFEGIDHQFPDEATDDEISAALEEDSKPSPTVPQGPAPSNFFPTASKVEGGGLGPTAKRIGLGALDLMGVPTRALAAATTDQKMSDPDAYALKPLIEEADKSVALLSKNPYPGQIISGGSDLLDRVVSDPISYAGLVAKSLSYIPSLFRGAGAAAGAANKLAGWTAAKATGVPVEALRAAGSPYGRARMAKNFGQERAIGSDLLNKIDHANDYIPERAIVDAGLEKMPPMDLGSAIQSLEGGKGAAVAGRVAPHKAVANEAIDRYVKFLQGGEIPEDIVKTAAEVGATSKAKEAQNISRIVTDADTYYHGASSGVPGGTSGIAQLSFDPEIARMYAGKSGKAFTVSPGKSKVIDLNDYNEIDKIKSDLISDYHNGRLGQFGIEMEDALGKSHLDESDFQKIASSFNPKDIVNSAENWDNENAFTWFTNKYDADFVKTKNGGISLDPSKADFSDLNTEGSINILGGDRKFSDLAIEKGADVTPGKFVSAKDYRKLRQDLDVPIDWDAEGAGIKSAALKSGRTTMKNELLKAAEASGDPAYAEAMKSWSSKLDKLERIKDLLGKTGTARDKRVEQFISNLFGRNNKYKTELMADIDNIFGGNTVSRAKAADMAKKFGESGKPGLLPVYGTGGSVNAAVNMGLVLPRAAAAVGTLGTASPLIASRLTLPALTGLERGLKDAGVALTPKAQKVMAALRKPATEAQKVRLASILATELEGAIPDNVIPFRTKAAAEATDEPKRVKTLRAALERAKDERTRAKIQAEIDRLTGSPLSMKAAP